MLILFYLIIWHCLFDIRERREFQIRLTQVTKDILDKILHTLSRSENVNYIHDSMDGWMDGWTIGYRVATALRIVYWPSLSILG